jgi:hypothetical protein
MKWFTQVLEVMKRIMSGLARTQRGRICKRKKGIRNFCLLILYKMDVKLGEDKNYEPVYFLSR